MMNTSTGDDPSTGTPGDSTTGPDDTTGELVLADIEVTINYEGDAVGPLVVAALTEFPPMGPPVASVREDNPTFPWTGTLSNLEPGEYFVLALIDVGDDSPIGPGPEDPQGMPEMSVMVDGEGPFTTELTLADPM